MSRTICRLTVLVIATVAGRSAIAQSPDATDAAPRISIVLKHVDDLLADSEYILRLTNQREQKQWPVLEEYADLFLVGIDRTKPICMDLILADGTERYITSIPVNDLKKFRADNLVPAGINYRKSRGKPFYKLSGAFEGYMRHIHDYGIFAELKTEVPADIADPQIDISSLLKRNYDIALEGRNKLADEKSQATRSSTFEQTRKATLARLKKLKDEKPIDLELRKMLLDQELDEFGRLYVESKHTIFGWEMDADAKPVEGRLEFLMTPLPETSLDKSMRQIGREPSRFANVERSENYILSARMNLPLDLMRQENLLELTALLLKRTGQNIDANKEATAAQKSARKSIADGLSAMINATTHKGLADGFIEAHSNDSNHNTLVAGFHFSDGEAIVELLKKVPEARDGQQVEIDFDKEGSVRIHKLLLSADRRVQFNQFFGSTELYVGSEKEVVWVAAGENALSELKETIKKVAAPNGAEPNAPFADLFMHMAPWMQLRQQAAGRMGDPKLRKMAVDAFLPEDDTMTFRMERVEENQARGVITCETGLLRLAGKILADFSKENLDE